MTELTTPFPDWITIYRGLAVYRFGQGAPLFLMPGPHRFQRPGLRSADALISGLMGLGRQVITFDPPGSGRSTRPAKVSMQEMHACTEEALEAADVEAPVDLLGHSMGGLVALAYALERPEKVARLVLVGTGVGGRAYLQAPGALWNGSHPAFWEQALTGVLHLVWPSRAAETINLNLIAKYSFRNRRLAQPAAVHWRDWFRPKQGRGTEWHKVAKDLDYAPRLEKVRAPTLVLCGRHDPQYPPACSEELASGIPGSGEVVYFENSGHFPFIEEPAAFWAAVATFLNPKSPAKSRPDGERHVIGG